MLDLFTIFSKGGIVLWYFQGTSQLLTNSVNELIKNVILQERGVSSAWNHNTLSLQYKLDNEFELVFVVAYQNILKLAYIDKFLSEIQLRFRDKYKQVVHGYSAGGSGSLDQDTFADFTNDFNLVLKQCEEEARQSSLVSQKPRSYKESDKSTRTVASMIETRKPGFLSSLVSSATAAATTAPANNANNSNNNQQETTASLVKSGGQPEENETSTLLAAPLSPGKPASGVKTMRKFEKPVKPKNGGGDASSPQAAKPKGKSNRKWVEDENVKLDFSNEKDASANSDTSQTELTSQYASKDVVGKLSGDLSSIEVVSNDDEFVYDDDDDDVDEPNNNNARGNNNKSSAKASSTAKVNVQKKAPTSGSSSSGGGGFFSSLKSLVGAKTLTSESMKPVMDRMKEHLISKNVASEIAEKVCNNVAQNLEGKQLSSFQFVANIVKQALHESMVQILTPKKRVDILRDVYEAQRQRKPYVIVFCGVNGVGKSTNLAKVTFWLIENSFRVLIAACDTFRSGAVEQLRTHTRHLNALHPAEAHNGRQMVELFEKGYGRDAATIAHDAISHARDERIDVVLVDTAGRMQDNEPLMKELAKLINVNNPDLVLFVGEALVGNEAVDQVKKFNQSLIDHSTARGVIGGAGGGAGGEQHVRTIDGIVLTKFDTIDDKVGAAISMTYTTGQPIVFVGTGQTYSDLKNLNAQSVVQSLLK